VVCMDCAVRCVLCMTGSFFLVQRHIDQLAAFFRLLPPRSMSKSAVPSAVASELTDHTSFIHSPQLSPLPGFLTAIAANVAANGGNAKAIAKVFGSGRRKYAAETQAPMPFNGTSLIYHLTSDQVSFLKLESVCIKLKRGLQSIAGIAPGQTGFPLAFVDPKHSHITNFDLLANESGTEETLFKAGMGTFVHVQQQVESVAREFVKQYLATKGPVHLVGTTKGLVSFRGMVVVVGIDLDETTSAFMRSFRLSLHQRLISAVPGYALIKGSKDEAQIASFEPHITLAYAVSPVGEVKQQTAFVQLALEADLIVTKGPIRFHLGDVCSFASMDDFTVT
jgi:hypothetical protein